MVAKEANEARTNQKAVNPLVKEMARTTMERKLVKVKAKALMG